MNMALDESGGNLPLAGPYHHGRVIKQHRVHSFLVTARTAEILLYATSPGYYLVFPGKKPITR